MKKIFDRMTSYTGDNPYNFDVEDVTNYATEFNLESMDVIRWAPVWMSRAERLMLYTLAYALRPRRYLEIGTLHGGSALLVCTALDALNSSGQIVCVDPDAKIDPAHWERLKKRTKLVSGYSPQVLPESVEVAGGLFDFVLIDGDHTKQGVIRDAKGVLSVVTNGAYILFHDSLNSEVAEGIDYFVNKNRKRVVDFGTLTREATFVNGVRWGGLRMVQVRQ